MENNSIRKFTCSDCLEVSEVDWSKVRPDLDDGTSNIEIHAKGNDYAYYGECMNCGNLEEIEPPVPDLYVSNVDVDKSGISIEITDKVTNRSLWIDAWKNDTDEDWEYDFNQYIFHLDNDNDLIAKMFQKDLSNYSEEVFDCVMGAIDDYEDEYNKLQENKALTMRDRLKEAKRNRCEHKKTEALEEKNQEAGVCPVCGNTDLDYGDTIMEQVGDYYGYNWRCSKCNHTGTEWYYMSFVDVYNTNTGEESHQEGICPDCGSDLMYDNFVPDGMDGYYEVYCDNCGFTGKEDYNLDFTDHTVNEEINESKEVKKENKQNITEDTTSSEFTLLVRPDELEFVNTSALAFDSDTTIAVYKDGTYELSLMVRGSIKIVNKENGDVYKNWQSYPEDLKELVTSGEIEHGGETDKYIVEMNNWFEWFLDKVEDNEADNVWYDVADIEGMLNKPTPEENETELEVIMKDLFDDIVGQLNEGKKVEAKFKDKVKAIKKSLKKNDKRLSDETAKKSAEKIAGSMVKKEESKTADMDTAEIVMELEGGELTIVDVEDWNAVKSVAGDLQNSQGYYGRLLRDMLETEEEFGGVENLPFPITM